MRIGIDVSQIVYEGTGVGRYVRELVKALIYADSVNSYILFGSSARQQTKLRAFYAEITAIRPTVKCISFTLPPSFFAFIWNNLHIIPITWFTGPLDIFWSSDWTQPPLGGVYGITTIHDVSFLRYPQHFDKTILSVQRKRLYWAKRECSHFFCDSQATQNDVEQLLEIPVSRFSVIYPGYSYPTM